MAHLQATEVSSAKCMIKFHHSIWNQITPYSLVFGIVTTRIQRTQAVEFLMSVATLMWKCLHLLHTSIYTHSYNANRSGHAEKHIGSKALCRIIFPCPHMISKSWSKGRGWTSHQAERRWEETGRFPIWLRFKNRKIKIKIKPKPNWLLRWYLGVDGAHWLFIYFYLSSSEIHCT